MLNLLPEPAVTVVATAAFTGLRKGELRGLDWKDYADAELRISRSVWSQEVSDPKTRKSKSPIPVISPLASFLERHRQAARSPQHGWIFAASNGRPLHLDNLARREIKPLLKKAGLSWHGWHAFRRGLATNLYGVGTPDKTIQAIMRHANLPTTMNHYVKSAPGDAVEAMHRLETVCNERAMAAFARSSEVVIN
ncbi:MAG: phage integrase [Acidobacteriaceae bacterium]|jgi:integrase|nr:phage integrase [Acidobacteriaceae bacterium]